MSEVVDVAEELTVQLREADHRDGAVLVEGPGVALQPGAEVSNVRCNLLNHHPPGTQSSKNNKVSPFVLDCPLNKAHNKRILPHFAAPDGLRCVKLSEEYLRNSFGLIILKVTHHSLGQHRAQNTALH